MSRCPRRTARSWRSTRTAPTLPLDAWRKRFSDAEREIGVLVYAGLFVSEDAELRRTFADKAGTGVRVLLGDPDSEPVATRGADEGVDDAMAAKIRNALALYRPLLACGGIGSASTRRSCTTRSTSAMTSCS